MKSPIALFLLLPALLLAQSNGGRQPAPLVLAHVEDDRLRLIFTCCHPSRAPEAHVALTLREVCGLTTEEIAKAFLITPRTLAQRIVCAKAKIRETRSALLIMVAFISPRWGDNDLRGR